MALAVSTITTRASVPSGAPVFTNPLNITNVWQPFQPGGVKVFAGSKDGLRAVTVDTYLAETRAFTVNGNSVACHILQEMSFQDGELVEVSHNYFAQADNGAVYYFGEVVDIYRDGAVINHDGSWLVGGATLPSDPTTTASANVPALFMPANPEIGDVFKPEDLFPVVDETAEIVGTGRVVRVPADYYTNAILLKETTQLSAADREYKTYAAGVGVLTARAHGESLRLLASSLKPLE